MTYRERRRRLLQATAWTSASVNRREHVRRIERELIRLADFWRDRVRTR